ncbi:MAG: sensor domain-containing diguanylate cyclase [Rhodocyclaceae bacterium]|nr:sensor domain-containing diguanylate cyclase [Rhodocyclaceae bacterium]
MKHLVVPTFVLNAEGRVIIWNRACERLTGVRADEVVGTTRHRLAFYDKDRPTLADLIAQGRTDEIEALYAGYDVASNSEHGFHAENWCVMPRVRTRLYLHIDAGPIFTSDGRLLSVVETLRDMTLQKEAQEELERLASRDPLTGLANRRAFDIHLGSEWRRGRNSAHELSVLMLDVDRFKQYNDRYGHLQGDTCLRSVASVLAGAAARTGDLVSRYGGEEFVLVLPGTTNQGARVVAQRILGAVSALRIPHADSPHDQVLTVSIGVATGDPGVISQEALIARADSALYRAKHAGRNCVVCADRDEEPGETGAA